MKPLTAGVVFQMILFHAAGAAGQNTKPADQWRIPADKEMFHVFLLMGQSNMSGYAYMLSADRIPVPRVVKLPTKYKRQLKWVPAAHPLHNRLKSDRFGLGLPFAVEYLKDKPGVVVGLIPVARGGAPIDRLKKGTAIYADAMKKVQFAMQRGVLKGVLWHQGESDTISETAANSYEKKLHKLIADLRGDIKDDKLPFIVGNLAEFYGTSKEHSQPDRVKRIDKIRGILRALPGKVRHTGFVESTGCSSPDHHNVHFDRKSYILLGQRYAQVYKTLTNKSRPKLKTRGGRLLLQMPRPVCRYVFGPKPHLMGLCPPEAGFRPGLLALVRRAAVSPPPLLPARLRRAGRRGGGLVWGSCPQD